MVISTFSVLDKDDRERFFEESFLLADVKLERVFQIFFLTMSNTDVDFQAWNLQWRSYTTGDVFSTTRRVELIKKKEFTAVVLDLEYETFVVHITALNVNPSNEIHPSKKAQLAHLKADEAFTKVSSKYTNFADVFLPKLAAELPENTRINNHTIELIDD